MSVIEGEIKPFWDNNFKNFSYTKQPAKNEEIERWRYMGYSHKSFTGSMYGGKNLMPNWVWEISNSLELYKPGFVFYRMKTGDIMPTHVDHFEKYCEIFEVERWQVKRAVVFLEDWKIGHYFDIGEKAIVNYKAGKYVIWDCDEPHFAANIGTEPRYTLQITGIR
jgi:hypothetical protein